MFRLKRMLIFNPQLNLPKYKTRVSAKFYAKTAPIYEIQIPHFLALLSTNFKVAKLKPLRWIHFNFFVQEIAGFKIRIFWTKKMR